ncbi:proline-rich transmembrane protein 1-like [Saccostrea echinata]|uniref:proline-rich transmembrane protein 1-like n=1 Tax=Saccostrea echinata TaxID=191078 RepID=UPI002A80A392|nr:proline-rich transmembrane protein 1-like [Saccostrea echinata]
MDTKKAGGYVQNPEQPNNPYNAGYTQTAYGQQQPVGYGSMSSNTSTNVVVTSAPTYIVVAAPRGNDWLVPAILSCLCCFWPTGICAITAAVNARARFDVGDYEGGRSSASLAKGLTFTSLGVGILSAVVFIVLYVVLWKETENKINGYTTITTPPWK